MVRLGKSCTYKDNRKNGWTVGLSGVPALLQVTSAGPAHHSIATIPPTNKTDGHGTTAEFNCHGVSEWDLYIACKVSISFMLSGMVIAG